jgi:hypothetical protein
VERREHEVPVSAAVTALEMVSWSRISPTMMTFTSSRKAAWSAHGNPARHMHFALMDERLLLVEEVFDRVLDGDDVLGARLVDAVDDGRERRGLSLPHRTHDEEEALGALREYFEHGREIESVNVRSRAG